MSLTFARPEQVTEVSYWESFHLGSGCEQFNLAVVIDDSAIELL